MRRSAGRGKPGSSSGRFSEAASGLACTRLGLAALLRARRPRIAMYKNRTIPLGIPPNSSIFATFTLLLRLLPGLHANPRSASPLSRSWLYFPAASFSAQQPYRPGHGLILPQHDDRPARPVHGWHEFEQRLSWPTMQRHRRALTSRTPLSTYNL